MRCMAYTLSIIRFIEHDNICSVGEISHVSWNPKLCCHVQKVPRHRFLSCARLIQPTLSRPFFLTSWHVLSIIFCCMALEYYSDAQNVEPNCWSSLLALHPGSLLVESALRFTLILSSYLRLGQRCGIFSWERSTKILCEGKFVLVHVMKADRGSGLKVWLHSFLTSALGGVEWWVLRTGHFTHGKSTPDTDFCCCFLCVSV